MTPPVRRVAVVTGTRADYGLLRPTIARLHADERFELSLVVAAMHLSPLFGMTVSEIEADGFPIAARVPTENAGEDRPASFALRIAEGLTGFARALEEVDPDVLLVLGDRWEMLAAALAATGQGVPIAHVHGGELSEGSLDDAMRHCLTKLAHLHFVAAREYGERVCQLGEQPGRVHVAGAAGIESILTLPLVSREELADDLGAQLEHPLAALTFHPESLDPGEAGAHADAVVSAVEAAFDGRGSVVVTLPNDDPGNAAVRERMLRLAAERPNVVAVESLGQLRYLSLLSHADVVVGNSSSGVLEAPSFRVPVVNVGDRQRGRLMAANVIGAAPDRDAVAAALERALDPAFRASLDGMESPFGSGRTSEAIVEALAEAPLDTLREKRFLDLPDGPWRGPLEFAGGPA
jgi:UDP-N-acetylglucosamine 2-epimerase (non-hydrolysing)